MFFKLGKAETTIFSQKLWWPVGYGDAGIYDTEVSVLLDGRVVSTRKVNVGISYATRIVQSLAKDEKPLQRAIMAAVNSIMESKENINGRIMNAAWEKLDGFPYFTITLGDINRRMGELEADFDILLHQTDSTGKNVDRLPMRW